MARGMTSITILFVAAASLNFASLTFASISEQENREAVKAMTAAEQSVGEELGNYPLTDQDGKRFNLKDLYARPLIVSFIYTRCPHSCSTITASLATALKEVENSQPPLNPSLVKGEKWGFNIVTIGFDYERDTPERMREFGKGFTDDFNRWRFVTGDKDSIERLSRDIGFYFVRRGEGFSHLDMVSIIAPGGKVYQHIYGVDIKGKDIITSLEGLSAGKRGKEALASPGSWRQRLISMCALYDASTQTYRINYFNIIRLMFEVTSPIVFILVMWRREVYFLYARVIESVGGV